MTLHSCVAANFSNVLTQKYFQHLSSSKCHEIFFGDPIEFMYWTELASLGGCSFFSALANIEMMLMQTWDVCNAGVQSFDSVDKQM